MLLINPNPKKDWDFDEECFYFISHLNMIGKAIIAGINPVEEAVHICDKRFETDYHFSMNCIFETQADAVQALREQLGRD